MVKPGPSISVIMPAYNEELGLEQAVSKTLETFRKLALDFELILVNDKSRDRTGEIAEKIALQEKMVRCFHHQVNQGIGGGFRTGVAKATMDYVILIPVDNPLSPEDIEAFLAHIPACDIVVGVRVERVGYPLFARFGSWVYNRIFVPLLFNIGVADVNWIQLYRRSLFTEGKISVNYTGIVFLLEILAKARRERLIICEASCCMRKRAHGKPTVFRLRVIWRTFRDMISLFRTLNRDS